MEIAVLFSVAIISFLIGFLVKFVDFIEDDLKNIKKNIFLKKLSLPLGFLYGLLIALVLIFWPILFPLAIGTILGEVLAKKIDSKGHFVALFMFVALGGLLVSLGILNIGINFFFIFLIIAFFIASLLDELGDKRFEKIQSKNPFFFIFSFRPFLELTAFLVSLILSEWIIWVTIFSFDLAYILFTNILPKVISSKK